MSEETEASDCSPLILPAPKSASPLQLCSDSSLLKLRGPVLPPVLWLPASLTFSKTSPGIFTAVSGPVLLSVIFEKATSCLRLYLLFQLHLCSLSQPNNSEVLSAHTASTLHLPVTLPPTSIWRPSPPPPLHSSWRSPVASVSPTPTSTLLSSSWLLSSIPHPLLLGNTFSRLRRLCVSGSPHPPFRLFLLFSFLNIGCPRLDPWPVSPSVHPR